MEQREVKDQEGTTWTCVQAYAGLEDDAQEQATEITEGEDQEAEVICTPDGGAQTVRLRLPKYWMEGIPEEELLKEIRSAAS